MVVIPGPLTPLDTTVNMSTWGTELTNGIDRVLHNTSQVVVAQFQVSPTVPMLKYWFLDGTQAGEYVVTSGGNDLNYVFDMAYDAQNTCYYMAGLTTAGSGICVFKTNMQGVWTGNFINEVDFSDDLLTGNKAANFATWDQGQVQLTMDDGTNDGDIPNVYLKITDRLYKISTSGTIGYVDGLSGLEAVSVAYNTITDLGTVGVSSLNWVSYTGQDYVTYLRHVTGLGNDYIKRIDDTALALDSKQVQLTMASYNTTWTSVSNYKLFFNQRDFNTCYYVFGTGSYDLYEFNVDETMAAFVAVNVDDAIMAAGTDAQTTITAEVINAYGDPLTGKDVVFSSNAYGSIIPPSTVTTSGGGVATATFQVGGSTGTATITATITES